MKANREPRETGMLRDQLADRPFLKNGGCDCKNLGPDYMSRAVSVCRDNFQPGIT